MSWESEKQKYLSMSMDEKRKNYADYIKWQDIPSWKTYAKETKLAPKIDLLAEHTIDNSKNSVLSDKVCILSGDITTLEVNMINGKHNKTFLCCFLGGCNCKCGQ